MRGSSDGQRQSAFVVVVFFFLFMEKQACSVLRYVHVHTHVFAHTWPLACRGPHLLFAPSASAGSL